MNRLDNLDGDRIVIIGGGLGGLAAACVLAARGYRVTLIERNAWLGGKAAVLEEEGYRFDMGPTILTMPKVLRRIFAEAGQVLEDELDLVRLDPQWRCFFEDGSTLDLREERQAMGDHLDRFAPGGSTSQDYQAFVKYAERLHEIAERHFFWRSVGGLRDMFEARQSLRASTLRDVLDMRIGRSVGGTVRRFVDEPRVAQMLDHFTQYVGSSPFGSPAILCGIASMQVNEGVWYPVGGTRAVPEALHRLASSLGVEFRTGERVERIVVERGRVRGVVTDTGETLRCGAAVSNMDAVRTFRELLPDVHEQSGRKGQPEPACSGVVLYLGLRKRYEQLAHHNFVFSEDPHDEFDAIYKRGEPAPDPTCYLAAPAGTEPGVAPPGGESLYVLVHTPYLRPHHDWSRMLPGYREVILDKLQRVAGLENLRDNIAFERHLTPRDIHERYQVLDGAIYGLASHGKMLGAFKPANRTAVEGLYLAGGAAHPGPGMPMVLMSGWIAADTLDNDGVVPPAREAVGTTPSEAIAMA